MKKLKRVVCILLVFGLLTFFIANMDAFWISSSAADEQTVIEGFSERAAENDSLALYINREKATFALYNKTTKQTFHSNPPGREQDTIAKGVNRVLLSSILSITYYDSVAKQLNTVNNVSDCLNEGGLGIRLMKKGAEFDFTFPTLKIMVPLQIQLLDNYLSVKIPVSKIKETGNNRVYSIDVAPLFGAGGLNDTGFMLIPDGSGGLIHFNNGKTYANEYAEPVYGADASETPDVTGNTKETIRLPVFGIKNNDSSFLAVISEGASQAVIHSSTSQKRNSYNTVYSSFEIRKIGSYSLDQGYEGSKSFAVYQETKPALPLVEIRYFPLRAGDGLKEMAAAYKGYLKKYEGLKEKQVKTGPVISLIGAVKKKASFLGIPYMVTKPVTTFGDAENMMQYFKDQGLREFDIRFTQWSNEQLKGNLLKNLSPLNALGGKGAYSKLSGYAKDNKIGFYPQADLLSYTNESYPFQMYFEAAKNINGSVVKQSFYKISTFVKDLTKPTMLLARPSLLKANTEQLIKNNSSLKATGLAIDGVGSINYSDFSNSTSERWQTQREAEASLNIIQKGTGKLMLSDANAYAFQYADVLIDIPVGTDKMDIIDETVPFYQLSISGLVDYATSPINLYHSPEELLLSALATGSRPHYMLGARDTDIALRNTTLDNNIGIDYLFWRENISQHYKKYKEAITQIGSTVITNFENIQKGVTRTYFESSKSLIVNYTDKDIVVNGHSVLAKSYFIEDGR